MFLEGFGLSSAIEVSRVTDKVGIMTTPKGPLAFETLKGPLRCFQEISVMILFEVNIRKVPNFTEFLGAHGVSFTPRI